MEISRGLLSIARPTLRRAWCPLLALALMPGVSRCRDPQTSEHADRPAVRSNRVRGTVGELELLGFSQGVHPGSASLRLARYEIFRVPPIGHSRKPGAARSVSGPTDPPLQRAAKTRKAKPADQTGRPFARESVAPAPDSPPVAKPPAVDTDPGLPKTSLSVNARQGMVVPGNRSTPELKGPALPDPAAGESPSEIVDSQPRATTADPVAECPALPVPAPELRTPGLAEEGPAAGSADRTNRPTPEPNTPVGDPALTGLLVLPPPAAAAVPAAEPPESPAPTDTPPPMSPKTSQAKDLASHHAALPVPASPPASPTAEAKYLVQGDRGSALPVPGPEADYPVRGDEWSAPVPGVAPAVADRARQLIEEGIQLAERGALYSARARFVMALRLVTQALDTQTQSQRFSRALADGLRALEEAQDFQPRGSRLEAQLDLPQVVSTHQTTILKTTDLSRWTALAALRRYHAYAEEQLSRAGGREIAAADALYGLARLQPLLNSRTEEQQSAAGPTAMSLYQAALMIHPAHYLAANELGTLFAHFGQWQDARDVLRHAATARPECPVVWQNLAQVHERLGEHDLAALARHESQVALRFSEQPSATDSRLTVQWVDPKTFADLSHDDGRPPTTLPPATRPPATRDSAENAPGTLSDRRQSPSLPSAQDSPLSARQRLGSRDAYYREHTPDTTYRRR